MKNPSISSQTEVSIFLKKASDEFFFAARSTQILRYRNRIWSLPSKEHIRLNEIRGRYLNWTITQTNSEYISWWIIFATENILFTIPIKRLFGKKDFSRIFLRLTQRWIIRNHLRLNVLVDYRRLSLLTFDVYEYHLLLYSHCWLTISKDVVHLLNKTFILLISDLYLPVAFDGVVIVFIEECNQQMLFKVICECVILFYTSRTNKS